MFKTLCAVVYTCSAVILSAGDSIHVGTHQLFTSLKDALECANDGDIVMVHEGLYQEGNIVVNKSVELIGKDFPIFDGQGNHEIFTIVADHVKISGFVVKNVGTSYIEDRAGIRIKKSNNFIISDNKLLNTFFGIYIEHGQDGIIKNNIIIGEAEQEMSSGNAIHLWYCKNVDVQNNLVKCHRDGIYLEFVDSSLVSFNRSEGNLRYGLHFMFSNDDEYSENEFIDNGAGVAVMFSRNIGMYKNIFSKNWGKSSYGLLLKEIYDAEIRNNWFSENTIAIYVEGSTRINYQFNEFSRNGWAMKISGGCLDNYVSQNNFISNTFDLSISQNINENKFDGNYWSEYSGYDLDKDGIGDVPHRPVKLFNYVVDRTPEAMILLRSLFVDLINLSEKVSPVISPKNVVDNLPKLEKLKFTSV